MNGRPTHALSRKLRTVYEPLAGCERIVCAFFRTVAFSSLAYDLHGMSDEALGEARRDTRYFAINNGLRAAFIGLLVFALRADPGVPFALAVFGFLFHGFLAGVETFRFWLLKGFKFRGFPPPPRKVPEPAGVHPYFGPHPWESQALYRFLGADPARKLVLGYKAWARREFDESLGPQPRPQHAKSYGLASVHQSRWAEVVHLTGIGVDYVILVGTLRLHDYWWIVPAMGLFLDTELVIIQRANREKLRRLHGRILRPRVSSKPS